MNVLEIIITVCATVAGSVAIAYATFYLQGRRRKRSLFKALFNEIGLNLSIARDQAREHDLIFERAFLYREAYQNIRVTGELLSLPELIRRRLENTYELINAHNRQIPAAMEIIPRDRGLKERLEKIIENLVILETEFPKHVKYLKK